MPSLHLHPALDHIFSLSARPYNLSKISQNASTAPASSKKIPEHIINLLGTDGEHVRTWFDFVELPNARIQYIAQMAARPTRESQPFQSLSTCQNTIMYGNLESPEAPAQSVPPPHWGF